MRDRILPCVVFAYVLAAAACGDNTSAPEPDPDPGCDAGYVDVGGMCLDIDECSRGDRCDANASCTNTPGAFRCACAAGWIGDGETCELAPCRYHYTAGHGDMYASWDEASGLSLALRSTLGGDTSERTYAPADVCIHVPSTTFDEIVSLGGRPPGDGWDPIGVAAGESFWFLPELALAGVPWFGVASDPSPAGGIPVGIFEPYVTLKLTVTPPPGGAFSAWSAVFDPEAPPFLFSTAAQQGEARFITSSHAHLSWAFTRPGTYLLEAVVSATRLRDAVQLSSPPALYRIIVEDS